VHSHRGPYVKCLRESRDRLYGLLGLFDGLEFNQFIEVDYAKQVEAVYYDAVKLLYEEDEIVTPHQEAGYVQPALTLGEDMGMPHSLLRILREERSTGDRVHG